jgi:hypothetical protein
VSSLGQRWGSTLGNPTPYGGPSLRLDEPGGVAPLAGGGDDRIDKFDMGAAFRGPAVRPPLVAVLMSMAAYFATAALGIRSICVPWASSTDETSASDAALALKVMVAQYLLESSAAFILGWVSMHAWRRDEVCQHHLPAAIIYLPLLLFDAWQPGQWVPMLQQHPWLVALIASAGLTGLNEGTFVARALLPLELADARQATEAQSWLTLATITQNFLISQCSCALGLRALGLPLLTPSGPPMSAYDTLYSATLCAECLAGAVFGWTLQVGYVRGNIKKLRGLRADRRSSPGHAPGHAVPGDQAVDKKKV